AQLSEILVSVRQFAPGIAGSLRMEFEFNAGTMMFFHFVQGRKVRFDPFHPLSALPAAPMILAVRRQNHIAKGELRFGQIATNEVGILRRESLAAKLLRREEQSRTAVQQQPRGL